LSVQITHTILSSHHLIHGIQHNHVIEYLLCGVQPFSLIAQAEFELTIVFMETHTSILKHFLSAKAKC
jgi:hypothetical protein